MKCNERKADGELCGAKIGKKFEASKKCGKHQKSSSSNTLIKNNLTNNSSGLSEDWDSINPIYIKMHLTLYETREAPLTENDLDYIYDLMSTNWDRRAVLAHPDLGEMTIRKAYKEGGFDLELSRLKKLPADVKLELIDEHYGREGDSRILSNLYQNMTNEEIAEISELYGEKEMPSLNSDNGKDFCFWMKEQLNTVGYPRVSYMDGGEITGKTQSIGSTGFSIRELDDGNLRLHFVISGKKARVPYNRFKEVDRDGEVLDMHKPTKDISPEIERALMGTELGNYIVEDSCEQTGYQMHWDDDIEFELTIRSLD